MMQQTSSSGCVLSSGGHQLHSCHVVTSAPEKIKPDHGRESEDSPL